jgi:hypothetical protein
MDTQKQLNVPLQLDILNKLGVGGRSPRAASASSLEEGRKASNALSAAASGSAASSGFDFDSNTVVSSFCDSVDHDKTLREEHEENARIGSRGRSAASLQSSLEGGAPPPVPIHYGSVSSSSGSAGSRAEAWVLD